MDPKKLTSQHGGRYINSKRFKSSLGIQWLSLHAPNAGGLGSVPGQGTRSHMPQLRPEAAKSIHSFFFFFKILSF